MAKKNFKQFVCEKDFANVINEVKGCQFASIAYATGVEAMNKKLVGGKSNPYYGRVSAITTCSGIQIGANFENAVNNRLEEGKTYEVASLPWGEWIRPNYLIGHKGQTYLRYYLTKNSETKVNYYLDGELVDNSDMAAAIKSAIREKRESVKQSEAGIDKADQVKPMTCNIANVMSAVIDGATYIITKVI